MQRIRVIQLVTGLAIGEQVGGAELFGTQLARNLDKSTFRPGVWGLWKYGSKKETLWLQTLEKEKIFSGLLAQPTGQLLHDLRTAFSHLWQIVTDFRPHIINSHSERTDTFNLLLYLFHPLHPIAVRTMHTDEQWQKNPWLGAIMLNLVFPILFQSEIVVSQAIQQVLAKRLLARLLNRRATLCYNGIDETILSKTAIPDTLLPPGMPTKQPRIGIIGRLAKQKGHSTLFRAVKIMHQTMPVQLLVIGSGELESTLRELVTHLQIEEAVHFMGSRSDVLDIVPHLDLVVSSSLWEGFPTVLLEAMALQVPVVATDVSGSRELVKTGQTGILVPPRNPRQLAEAVLMLLQNPQKARAMAENARRAIAPFTIQNAALCYTSAYQKLGKHIH